MTDKLICYYTIFDYTDQEYEELSRRLLPLIPGERGKKARSLSFSHDRFNCCYAYLLLKYAVGKFVSQNIADDSVPVKELKILTKENGKPYLCDYPDIHFSISHVKNGVCLAISDSEVGADILDRRNISPTLLKKLHLEEPTGHLDYTALEAISKLDGAGIGMIMENFHKGINMLDDGYLAKNNIIISSHTKKEADFFISTASHKYSCEEFIQIIPSQILPFNI